MHICLEQNQNIYINLTISYTGAFRNHTVMGAIVLHFDLLRISVTDNFQLQTLSLAFSNVACVLRTSFLVDVGTARYAHDIINVYNYDYIRSCKGRYLGFYRSVLYCSYKVEKLAPFNPTVLHYYISCKW